MGIFSPLKCKYMFSALQKSNVQQNDWSISEDETLVQIIASNQYGQNGKFKWTKIAEALNYKVGNEGGFRLAKHCRERFFNHLNPSLKKGEWTLSEDILLLQSYLKHHKKWSLINAKLPGRNDNIVKNRFYKLMKMNKLMTKNRKNFNDEKILSLLDKLKASNHQEFNRSKVQNMEFNNPNEKTEIVYKFQMKETPTPVLFQNQPKQKSTETFPIEKKEINQNTHDLQECLHFQNQFFHNNELKNNQIQSDQTIITDDELYFVMSPQQLPKPPREDETLVDLDKIMNEIENINIYEQKNFKFVSNSILPKNLKRLWLG